MWRTCSIDRNENEEHTAARFGANLVDFFLVLFYSRINSKMHKFTHRTVVNFISFTLAENTNVGIFSVLAERVLRQLCHICAAAYSACGTE